MPSIKFSNVSVEYPLFRTASAMSIRSDMVKALTGGVLTVTRGSSPLVVRALSQVSFDIVKGDIVGFVGHNGSGKTTLLRTIMGIYKPIQGCVDINGKVKSLIDISAGLEPELSGTENIKRLLLLHGYSKDVFIENCEKIINFSGLGDYINLPVQTYSSGMMMRLLYSVMMYESTDIMLMDEFFSVGDKDFSKKVERDIHEKISNTSILVIATHNYETVKKYCNRVFKMENGKVEECSVESFTI